MSAVSSKRLQPKNRPAGSALGRLLREIGLLGLLAFAVYLLLCLASWTSTDPGPSHTGGSSDVANLGGRVGAYFADGMFHLFGQMAYLFLILV
ncbi:MAG: cell division protein FtsK, partial [Gammaproteobacteria bacterium]|nr:cell division protein FtsK [Gammaproteobacteria bacterium]